MDGFTVVSLALAVSSKFWDCEAVVVMSCISRLCLSVFLSVGAFRVGIGSGQYVG